MKKFEVIRNKFGFETDYFYVYAKSKESAVQTVYRMIPIIDMRQKTKEIGICEFVEIQGYHIEEV